MKFKGSKIIISVVSVAFLANLTLANFAFAQESPPKADTQMTRDDYVKANNPANQVNCDIFSKLVSEITNGDLKAAQTWIPKTYGESEPHIGCVIVDSTTILTDSGVGPFVDPVKGLISNLAKNTLTKLQQKDTVIKKSAWLKFKSDNLNAIGGANGVSQFIGWLLNIILSVIATALSALTAIASYIFIYATGQALDITTVPSVVNVGWGIVRDICNMAFILILITIALAAILRIEKYDYKALLAKLILMAILINFSKVIAITIMNVVNFVAVIFRGDGFEGITAAIFRVSDPSLIFNGGLGWQQALSEGIAKIGYAAAGLVVYIALALMFIIRIVGLYILIIFSPIAFAANILPATEEYAKKWWQHFFKYLIWAPVAMFMVRLTILVANDPKFSITNADIGDNSGFKFWILIGFLVAALLVAKEAGMVGGNAIVSGVTNAGKWAGKRGIGYTGRKWNEFTANKIRGGKEDVSRGRAIAYAVLNPVAFARGWAHDAEEKKHAAQEKATRAGQEVVEQRFNSPKAFFGKKGRMKIIPRVLQHEKAEEDKFAKEYGSMSREQVARKVAELSHLGNSDEDKAIKRAVMKVAMSKGYVDDAVGLAHTNESGREMIEEMIKIGDLHAGEDYETVEIQELNHDTGQFEANQVKKLIDSSHRTRHALQLAMFGGKLEKGFVDSNTGEFYEAHQARNAGDVEAEKVHISDHAAARLITEEGETEGKNTSHFEYMTDQKYNSKTGHYEGYTMRKVNGRWVSDGEEQMAGAELAKQNSRAQAGVAWHSLMSSDGKDLYEPVVRKVAKAFTENPQYMQERTSNMLVAGTLDEKDLDRIKAEYRRNGGDIMATVDAKSRARLQKLKAIDENMYKSIIARFMNEDKRAPKSDKTAQPQSQAAPTSTIVTSRPIDMDYDTRRPK